MSNPASFNSATSTSRTSPSASSVASFDDLVFQYRNKEYGAYYVRQNYQKNTFLALLIGTSFVLTLLLVPMILSSLTPAVAGPVMPSTPPIIFDDFPTLPPTVELPKTAPPSGSTTESLVYLAPKVVIDEEAFKNDFPTKEQIDTSNVGEKSQPGDNKWPGSGDPTKTKGNENPILTKPIENDKILTFAEMDADFPGGPDKMLQFLQENIYYPSGAKDAAIEGTVYVTFTVGKDGTLSDIKVNKGLGMGLDEAAIEGVKKMPKWTPARQNGSPTRLSKTIPVKFKLSN